MHNCNLSLSLGKVLILWKSSCVVPVPNSVQLREVKQFGLMVLTTNLKPEKHPDENNHQQPATPGSTLLEPLHFAYCPVIGKDDANIYLLHQSLSHLEKVGEGHLFLTFPVLSIKFNPHCWGRSCNVVCIMWPIMTVLSPLPFRSTHRSSDSTSLTVTSRCFLMIQPLLDVHLIREWSGKMGRPSLTLSSWSKVNINTSKTKEIEVLSFKAIFCWEGGTRNGLIDWWRRPVLWLAKTGKMRVLAKLVPIMDNTTPPLHETIYPFKSGNKNVFILSKQMENIDILITKWGKNWYNIILRY